ncbi:class I SAM-dependent methyltransferase [Gordonia sp. (in: high G+C Gram-positive bacteria)]|uniref:class I SAM-dependent methyltransferase n=1 Tax=Gordonia sp. (in: high G+C Gram-positive bacteria) TaxID=84139 RepID=UPI0016A246F4|nr:class I SAM-dependent methyltransferase [Gordonia sp. (in: high G+C Gram-positive bacteria)]NLG48202.1 class I SAM-dependent methyltransferase [Gordonia sp. (in: high G+C Gram-positive bacteria)]
MPRLRTPATPFARTATLRRAVHLLREFRYEQTDPARFYSALADDTAMMVAGLVSDPLDGKVILDVGGGPGFFADAFTARGARYLSVEPDAGEMSAAGLDQRTAVRAQGEHLPFRTGSVDVCYSSNVAEHTPTPWAMADEMVRVTRPGGTIILSYTLWWGPFGGHEMGLTHYAGGHRAVRWYTRKHGRLPKNLFGVSLFPITAAAGLQWARSTADAELLAAVPRYIPRFVWPVVHIPGIREVAATNLVLVLRKN